MGKKNDGGPAFPQTEMTDEYGNRDWPWMGHGMGGMGLRDYFAAQALSGFTANSRIKEDVDAKTVAKSMYALADAMLAELEKDDE